MLKSATMAVLAVALAAVPMHALAADDPIVKLDGAKMLLADGDLYGAWEELQTVEIDTAEYYVAAEIDFQRLLIAGSLMYASYFLISELEANNLAGSKYGEWLMGEFDKFSGSFAKEAEIYLANCGNGLVTDFVRFGLPTVNDDHLADAGLYTEEPVLNAAVKNWEDDRDALGKGIMLSQARIALVIFAARHYDLPDASANLEASTARLESGVPINKDVVLGWLAETAMAVSAAAPSLAEIADSAESLSGGLSKPLAFSQPREEQAAPNIDGSMPSD